MRLNISITIDIDIISEIDTLAANDRRTRSNMIEKLLKDALSKKQEKPNNQD